MEEPSSMEESHPEQYSDGARLRLRQSIHRNHSRIGHDLYGLAYALLDLRPTDSLLDVGCGLGDFLKLVRSHRHMGKLVGIDRSPGVIEEARRDTIESATGIEFRAGDAERLDFPAVSFDCVTALHVLGKADPDRVLQQIGRVLKAEGRVVLSTNSRSCYPILEELKDRARERFGWFLANEWTEGFESERATDILMRYFGRVEESRYEDVLQYTDAEVLVDFFRSSRGLWSEKLTEAEWTRIVDWARDQAIELIPEHGYVEDPKSFSLFLCSMPLGF